MFATMNGVGSNGLGVSSPRSSTPVEAVRQAQPVAARPQPVADDDQLLGFLRNITRADAAQVIALTQPDKADARQSYEAVARAYSEF